MASVSLVFSTYVCAPGGIFEDFYVEELRRHRGIARGLTQYIFEAMKARGIPSLWVGSAPAHEGMYNALGFITPIGKLLTWSATQ